MQFAALRHVSQIYEGVVADFVVRAGIAIGPARSGDGFHRFANRTVTSRVKLDLNALSVERGDRGEKRVFRDQLQSVPTTRALIVVCAAAMFIGR